MMALPKACAGRLIAALLIAPGLLNAAAAPPSPATVVALDPKITAGIGARLGFVEYEAESGATNARIVGPDVAFTTLAAEASGRDRTVGADDARIGRSEQHTSQLQSPHQLVCRLSLT